MEFVLTGEIKSKNFDRVVDIDRVEFSDKKNKIDVYFEFPRLEGLTTLENTNSITLEITDDFEKRADDSTKIALNTTLYMIRSDESKNNIVQFSAGGIILRLIANPKKHPFRLRGNRSFKIFISRS